MEKFFMEPDEVALREAIKTMLCLDNKTILKTIKTTTYFYNYIVAKFADDILWNGFDNNSAYAIFLSIPIIIDDTIEHPYYEFVYQKEK